MFSNLRTVCRTTKIVNHRSVQMVGTGSAEYSETDQTAQTVNVRNAKEDRGNMNISARGLLWAHRMKQGSVRVRQRLTENTMLRGPGRRKQIPTGRGVRTHRRGRIVFRVCYRKLCIIELAFQALCIISFQSLYLTVHLSLGQAKCVRVLGRFVSMSVCSLHLSVFVYVDAHVHDCLFTLVT